LVARCLRKDPAERWDSADALCGVLETTALPAARSSMVAVGPYGLRESSPAVAAAEHPEPARAAFARTAWREAYDGLRTADTADELEAEDLERLAEAAWWLSDGTASLRARERAYRKYLQCGELRAAAWVALALAEDHFHRLARSVGQGWLRRAERHLEGLADVAERGWLYRQLRGQPGADSLPLVVWEGQLTRDSNTVVVVPTVWEYDGVQDAFNDWARWLDGVPNQLKSNETFKNMAGSTLELASLGLDIALDLPEDEVTGARFLGFDVGKAKDRPIGMAKTAGADGKPHFTFMPKAYVIDLAKAERELASTVGGKAGVIAVPYADDPYLWGNYELYLKIERLSP
jgi:hypothetical protein